MLPRLRRRRVTEIVEYVTNHLLVTNLCYLAVVPQILILNTSFQSNYVSVLLICVNELNQCLYTFGHDIDLELKRVVWVVFETKTVV